MAQIRRSRQGDEVSTSEAAVEEITHTHIPMVSTGFHAFVGYRVWLSLVSMVSKFALENYKTIETFGRS